MSQPSEPKDPPQPASTSVGEVAPDAPDPPRAGDLDAPAVPFIGRRGHRRRGIEAAIMGTQDIAAWVIGLVVSVLSVVLAAILWSSRTL